MSDFKIDQKINSKIKDPSNYKVVIFNDDYTPVDFVIGILIKIFHKSYFEAMNITMTIHNSDKAVIGIYTYEIAETKAQQVLDEAKIYSYPLLAKIEK